MAVPDDSTAEPFDDLNGEEKDALAAVTISSWELRARIFLGTLPPERLAEIACRPRFRNLPWLRRADEPDQDQLP